MSQNGHETEIRIHIGWIKVKEKETKGQRWGITVTDLGREQNRNIKAVSERSWRHQNLLTMSTKHT